MNFLLLGLLTGVDNLAVSSGFGYLGLSIRDRLKLIVSFACFEALMPVLGFFVTSNTALRGVEWLGPAALLLCGTLVAWRVLNGRTAGAGRPIGSSASLILIPLFLSFDNLAAGAGLGAFGASSILTAALTGCVAAALSVAGLQLGCLASKRFSFNPQLACADVFYRPRRRRPFRGNPRGIRMNHPEKTPTFNDDIMPMLHQFAPQMRWRFDLTAYQDVKDNAPMIYERMSSKSPDDVMPPPPFSPLKPQQIKAFKEWMEHECPEE